MDLSIVLTYMFPGSQPGVDYGFGGDPLAINFWLLSSPQPTEAEMEAAWPAAQAAAALATLQTEAQDALSASDITVLRLIELNSTLVPADWVAYRTALRAIMSATAATNPIPALPVRPAYPAPGS